MILRRVTGYSMVPSLGPGQIILARKSRKLRVGDVVVFRHRGLEKIKRLHAVNDGRIHVRGDNKNLSTDSRHFGSLPIEHVVARVIWPKV